MINPVVSKIFCSPYEVNLIVRKRPHVANGGGFVVTNVVDQQKKLFSVDGCGVLGTDKELIVNDGNGVPILHICKKDGVLQVLRTHAQWKVYLMEYDGNIGRPVFILKEHKTVCFPGKRNDVVIRITTDPNGKGWDFETRGSFVDKSCTVVDHAGNLVAKVDGFEKMKAVNGFYLVHVQAGYDQAFVVGIIAVLDNIHYESTRC